MLNFFRKLFKRKSGLDLNTRRRLLADTSNFFYKEAMVAYEEAKKAQREGNEEALEAARKRFWIAERRYKMVSFEISEFIRSKR